MKTNYLNVLIGVAVIFTLLYFTNPSMFMKEGFYADQPQSEQIGGYIAIALFLFVVLGGFMAIAMKK